MRAEIEQRQLQYTVDIPRNKREIIRATVTLSPEDANRQLQQLLDNG